MTLYRECVKKKKRKTKKKAVRTKQDESELQVNSPQRQREDTSTNPTISPTTPRPNSPSASPARDPFTAAAQLQKDTTPISPIAWPYPNQQCIPRGNALGNAPSHPSRVAPTSQNILAALTTNPHVSGARGTENNVQITRMTFLVSYGAVFSVEITISCDVWSRSWVRMSAYRELDFLATGVELASLSAAFVCNGDAV